MDIFDDLEAEQDRLEKILAGLDGARWAAPSAAAGWSVTDVVLHLAQTEEAVVASTGGRSGQGEASGASRGLRAVARGQARGGARAARG
jgi:uncharacterized protein (TIGR03083 family)